ncbi:MAG: hypothetical protein WA876_13485 [Candidatus Acidiferrales bacterium]
MNEQTGITVVAAIGIVIGVILTILFIHNLQKQNPGSTSGQSQGPVCPE